MAIFEKGPGIRAGVRDLKLNASNISSGITGMVFSVSGIVVIFSNIASQAGMSQEQVISWMFAAFLLGGLLSIGFSLYYKMPLVFTNSLPAMALVGVLYGTFGQAQMVGGFVMSSLIVFIVGVSGLMGHIKRLLPIPIVMGMVSGIFLSFALNLLSAVQLQPLVCGAIVLSFLLTMRFFPKVPAQLTALVVAVIMSLLFLNFDAPVAQMHLGISKPIFVMPSFSISSLVSVSIPLALLALADSVKAYGVLKSNGYNPPLNSATAVGGCVSILGSLMMANIVGLAGVGTAIVATDVAGPRENRYAAAVIKNGFSVILALMVGFVYPFLNLLPVAVSNALAGLALLSLFTGSLGSAFGSGKFRLGAFAAMVVGVANLSIGSIGAPILALVVGVAVSLLAEHRDFVSLRAEQST